MATQRIPGPHASILVVGLVRNCGASLEADVLRLQLALAQTRQLSWLIVESDSTDNTVSVLDKLSSQIRDFRFLSLGALQGQIPQRTARIAHCRNAYLDELATNALYRNVDYVVVADLDGLNARISQEAIASCWARDDWDVCTANQDGPYYDLWALRHKEWCPNDCWAQFNFLFPYLGNKEKALYAAVYSKMIVLPKGSDWIEVDSAFGGLAIYRRQVIEMARYVGLRENGDEFCEHVPFHEALKAQGCRIFINPSLINAGYTEHSEQLLLKKKLTRMRKGAVKKLKTSVARTGLFKQVKSMLRRG